VRVNLDVLNAQAQLYTTQAQLARARYDLVVANLRLRQASGRVTPDDIGMVNRLLQP
jgi:outer membrane protein